MYRCRQVVPIFTTMTAAPTGAKVNNNSPPAQECRFYWKDNHYIPFEQLVAPPGSTPIFELRRDGCTMISRALLHHFRERCSMCGLKNHRSSSPYCPYKSPSVPLSARSQNFTLCHHCKTALHATCLLHKSAYPPKN